MEKPAPTGCKTWEAEGAGERISIVLAIQLTTYCSVISPSYIQGEVGTLFNGYVR